MGSVRPQGLLHRVTSPQEMASVQSQVLTQIAIKKKKELDDQKDRILRKQQADRSVVKFCISLKKIYNFV